MLFSFYNFFKNKNKTPAEVEGIFSYLVSLTRQSDSEENYINQFNKQKRKYKSRKEGDSVFIKLYLTWEEFLANNKLAAGEEITKEKIRTYIKNNIDITKLSPSFQLVFLSEREQGILIYELSLEKLAGYVINNLGLESFSRLMKEAGGDTVFEKITVIDKQIKFDKLNEVIVGDSITYPTAKIVQIFKGFISTFYNKIELSLGEHIAHGLFKKLYDDFQQTFNSDFASQLLKITPEKVLGLEEWISLLSKSELEKQVRYKTEELEILNDNLEKEVDSRTKELKVAYADLKELDKKKSEFISVAAHQIRTPVSGIKWVLDMVLNGEVGPITQEQKEMINKAHTANESLLLIVNDLLDTDMISTGKSKYRFKKLNIMAMIKQTIKELSAQIKQKDITITLKNKEGDDEESGLYNVFADKVKLQLVLQNLLDNAIHYSKVTSSIEVHVSNDTNNIILKVSDHGIGIPEDQQDDIFKRFYRAENGIRFRPDGSGLGLFITKNIVEKHKGSISFDSIEGKGTIFTVILPIKHNSE